MQHPVNFSETYLYKIRTLANILDKVFDRTLRAHADITLSQCMVLLTIAQHAGINQRQLAKHLGISAVAVKRQVDIAKRRGWVVVVGLDTRGDGLQMTDAASPVIGRALQALEQHVFAVFDTHNENANLVQHLDWLLASAKIALHKDSP